MNIGESYKVLESILGWPKIGSNDNKGVFMEPGTEFVIVGWTNFDGWINIITQDMQTLEVRDRSINGRCKLIK